MHLATTYRGNNEFDFDRVNLIRMKNETEETIGLIANFISRHFRCTRNPLEIASNYYYTFLFSDNILNSINKFQTESFNFFIENQCIDLNNKSEFKNSFIKFLTLIDEVVLGGHF